MSGRMRRSGCATLQACKQLTLRTAVRARERQRSVCRRERERERERDRQRETDRQTDRERERERERERVYQELLDNGGSGASPAHRLRIITMEKAAWTAFVNKHFISISPLVFTMELNSFFQGLWPPHTTDLKSNKPLSDPRYVYTWKVPYKALSLSHTHARTQGSVRPCKVRLWAVSARNSIFFLAAFNV
jgi:hypothetical protein